MEEAMPTFVLVHGSWAGSVVWRELAPRLRKAGHEVYAPTLTGIGARKHLLNREIDLDTHIQDVIGVIDDADLYDIVLAALPQFGDPQLQRAEPGIEGALAVAIAPGAPLAAALVAPGTDQPLDVGLHQQLQHRLRHGS